MGSNYRRIGNYIRLVDERNRDLKITKLVGLSISKQFIGSVANTVGSDMANYKIIRKGQFACSIMQVRRDKKMPVALLKEYDEAILSPAYPVFEVVDKTKLDPEYLMMWMSRSEFDRHACFLAVGGVRGSLEWEDFQNMPLPVPSIEKQREIVMEYHAVVNCIRLNEQLNQKLEETAQAVYRRWFVEFDFPSEALAKDGVSQPYKSSGGKMVWNEELGKEVPEGWSVKVLGAISEVKTGPFGSALLNEQYIVGGTPVITVEHIKGFRIASLNFPSVGEEDRNRLVSYTLERGDIVFSRVGSVDLNAMVREENIGWLFSSRMLRVRPDKNVINPLILSHYLRLPEVRSFIISISVGSTMPSINTNILKSVPIVLSPTTISNQLSEIFNVFDKRIAESLQQVQILKELKNLILAKMTKAETEESQEVLAERGIP